MRVRIILSTLLMLAMMAPAQKHFADFSPHPKFKKPPYLFQQVNEEFSAQESEVTVDNYCAFLKAITRDSSEEYVKKMMPGDQCELFPYIQPGVIKGTVKKTGNPEENRPIPWLDEEKFLEVESKKGKVVKEGVDKEFYNPYNHPVTGISLEQAKEFAWWCTSRLNGELDMQSKDAIEKVYMFRLPTPAEQAEMIRKGQEGCVDKKNPKVCEDNKAQMIACKNEKGCALCNVAAKDTCRDNVFSDEAFGKEALYSTWSYFPNWQGLYCVMGNAAEMSSEPGIAKGGSYLQKAEECQPASVQKYDAPQKWLGFRLVAQIKDIDEGGIWFDADGRMMFKK